VPGAARNGVQDAMKMPSTSKMPALAKFELCNGVIIETLAVFFKIFFLQRID
jgi:hypothetical protein